MFEKYYAKKIMLYFFLLAILMFAGNFFHFSNHIIEEQGLGFHTLLESSSVLIAFTIFVTVWNFRFDIKDDFILFIGTLFFAIGGIDMLHIFSYKGMPVFITEGSNQKATLLWIFGMMLTGLGMLGAVTTMIPKRQKDFKSKIHLLVTLLLLSAGFLFVTDIPAKLPLFYVEGLGNTYLTKISGTLAISINILTFVLLLKKRNELKEDVLSFVLLFLMTLSFAELFMLFNNETSSLYNFIGHVLKVIAYYQLFQGVYKDGVLENHLLASTVARLSRNILKPDTNLKQTVKYIVEAFHLHLKKPDRLVFYEAKGKKFVLLGVTGDYGEIIKLGSEAEVSFHISDFKKPTIHSSLEGLATFNFITEINTNALEQINKNTTELMFIPLEENGELLGFLLAYNFWKNKKYNIDDLIAADSLASFAILSLMHARVVGRMHEFSFEDSLTRLNNRRYFMEKLREVLYDGQRYSHKFSLVIIDLDGMKYLNDNFGHQAGDEALKTTARFLKDTFRQTDVVARLGGDEFGIIVRNSSRQQTEHKLNLLKQELVDYTMPDCQCQLSISFGVAEFLSDANEEELLIKIADDRMYDQKILSRNTRQNLIKVN